MFFVSGLATQRLRSGARQWRTRWDSFPHEFEFNYIFFLLVKVCENIIKTALFSFHRRAPTTNPAWPFSGRPWPSNPPWWRQKKTFFNVVLRENMTKVFLFLYYAIDQGEHNRPRSGHPPPGHQGGLQSDGEAESDLWRSIRNVQPVQAVDEPGEGEKVFLTFFWDKHGSRAEILFLIIIALFGQSWIVSFWGCSQVFFAAIFCNNRCG